MYGNNFFPPIGTGNLMPMSRGLGLGSAARGLGLGNATRGLGGKLGILKGINWGGLLNTASKTLGVVNQAVPLVKQVGPMFNNMKSMLKIASVFKDETDTKIPTNKKNEETVIEVNNDTKTIQYESDNTPNFFI